MEYIILPLAPVLLILAFIIILGIVGIAGLASVIVPILDQYFVHIIVFFFGLIILVCIILIVIVWLSDEHIYDKFFFSVNLLISAVISFPLFYMFFLEFCCSYGMGGIISSILSIIESVIGIVIAGFIFIIYLGVCMLLYYAILELDSESRFKFIGIVQIMLYMILTAANIFIVYHFYKICLHLLVKYYINAEALELYKNAFSPIVYDFMCFCRDLYEKIN